MKVKLPDGSVLELESPEEIEQYMILTGQKVHKTQAQILREQINQAAPPVAVAEPVAVAVALDVPIAVGENTRHVIPSQVGKPSPWEMRKISDLGMPALTTNILVRNEIATVGHLMRHTRERLRRLQGGFSELNMAHVVNALRERGLNLADPSHHTTVVVDSDSDMVKTIPRVFYVSELEWPTVEVLRAYPHGITTSDMASLLDWSHAKSSRVVTNMERQRRVVRRMPGNGRRFGLMADAVNARFERSFYPQTDQRKWDFENGY